MNFNGNYRQLPASGDTPSLSSVQRTLEQMKHLFDQMTSSISHASTPSLNQPQPGAGMQQLPTTNNTSQQMVNGAFPGQPPNINQVLSMAQNNPQMISTLTQMQNNGLRANASLPVNTNLPPLIDTSLPPPRLPNARPQSHVPFNSTPRGIPPYSVPPPSLPGAGFSLPTHGGRFQQPLGSFHLSQPPPAQSLHSSVPPACSASREDSFVKSNDKEYFSWRSGKSQSSRNPSRFRDHRRASRSPTHFSGSIQYEKTRCANKDRRANNNRFSNRRRCSRSPMRSNRVSDNQPNRSFSNSKFSRDRDIGQRSPKDRDSGKRYASCRPSSSPSRSSLTESRGSSGSRHQRDNNLSDRSRSSYNGRPDSYSRGRKPFTHGGRKDSAERRVRSKNDTFSNVGQSYPLFPSGPAVREKPKQYQTSYLPSDDEDELTNHKKLSKKGQHPKSSPNKKKPLSTQSISSDSSSSDSDMNMADTDDKLNASGDSVERLYGTYDERPTVQPTETRLADYVESTAAGRYLSKDAENGQMLATKHLVELEDRFEMTVLKRASRAREGRKEYKYPERTARLSCCKKEGCSHNSEDDATDESDQEEGEIVESDEEGQVEAKDTGPTVSAEVQAKLEHPERLHKMICFNDKGETNSGPLCKCSRRARRLGVRHAFYAGEKLLDVCRPDSNNLSRLFHYRISLSSLVNFETKEATIIRWDDRDYVFEGFSLFTHQRLDQMTSMRTILYNSYYTIKLVSEDAPSMFTVRTLDLVCDYIFYELLELMDLTWVREELKHGCRQIHLMPRFSRPLPDNGIELLAMPHVLKYLLDNSHPLIESSALGAVATMDKKVWEEKVVKKYRLTLATVPGMRPSTLRIDNMDRPIQMQKDVIGYPQILHYVFISDSLVPSNDKSFQQLMRKRRRINKYITKKVTPLTSKDVNELRSINYELERYKTKRKTADGSPFRRHQLVELSCQGYFATGLKSDVAMWGLIVPKVVDHIRFIQSLFFLQQDIGYRFKDPSLLQMALSHSSYMSGFCHNQDQIKNTLTNCGFRKPELGKFSIQKELKVKKRGLKTLLEIMSHNYRRYTGPMYCNERLEFLGDAVLEFISTVHLYFLFPDLEEGGLSTYRTAIIKNETLTRLAKKVGLQHYLLFSHGPDLCYSAHFDHSLANAFEALLGAIYLDSGGVEEPDRFLAKYLAESFNFSEFTPVWTDLPLHPLQVQYPDGDRHLIAANIPLQKCAQFEKATGMHFDHICILARALTHSNMNYTEFAQGSNQTLEFLGDSVLQLIVTHYLFNNYPNHHEGHLTLLRSSLVNNSTQAQIFKDLGIGHYVFKRNPHDVMQMKEKADYVEAIMGALYVDQGLDVCTMFCKVLFFPRLKETIENQNWNDAKSLLQQCCLELREPGSNKDPFIPTYKVVGRVGPSHNSRFKVAVYYKDQRIGVGEAHSIKSGQFEAAQNALDTNHAMFPMLKPGTNMLHTMGRQSLLQFITHRQQKVKRRNQNLNYAMQ
ncbi:ribonuclease 3-like [Watersipora subatra]|uniref:ribonuclease 3-like n=1 Tax=Watersipora subatra TaxID=2589382 RepID=UPI00355B6AA4